MLRGGGKEKAFAGTMARANLLDPELTGHGGRSAPLRKRVDNGNELAAPFSMSLTMLIAGKKAVAWGGVFYSTCMLFLPTCREAHQVINKFILSPSIQGTELAKFTCLPKTLSVRTLVPLPMLLWNKGTCNRCMYDLRESITNFVTNTIQMEF